MNGGTDGLTIAAGRIAMLLAAIYAGQQKDMDHGAKAAALSRFGFSNNEVAAILGLTPNAVGIALHRARKVSKSVRKKASR